MQYAAMTKPWSTLINFLRFSFIPRAIAVYFNGLILLMSLFLFDKADSGASNDRNYAPLWYDTKAGWRWKVVRKKKDERKLPSILTASYTYK